MSLPSVGEFAAEVEKLLDPDMRSRQVAEENLLQLYRSSAKGLLELCSLTIRHQSVTDRQIYCAMIVMWKCMTGPPFVKFRDYWCGQDYESLRNDIKATLFNCLRFDEVAVRNQAARLIAFIHRAEKNISNDLFDALNHIIMGNSSSLNQKLGALQTYKEVVEMSPKIYDPNKDLPQEWTDIARAIVIHIGSDTEDLTSVCACCEMVRLFVIHYKSIYNSIELVSLILEAIERRLGSANDVICDILYDIMLDLVFQFYENAHIFMERIFHITIVLGAQFGYNIKSLLFWGKFGKRERCLVNRNQERPQDYIRTAATNLVPLCLSVIPNLDGVDYSSEFLWSSCMSSAATKLLHTLIDVSGGQNAEQVCQFVEEQMSHETVGGSLCALCGIFGLTRGFSRTPVMEFVARQYAFVCRMTTTENLSVSHMAFRIVKELNTVLDTCYSKAPYISLTFRAIAENCGRPNKTDGLLETQMSVLDVMSRHLPGETLQMHIEDFLALFELLLNDPCVKKSSMIKEPYKIIGEILRNLPTSVENRQHILGLLVKNLDGVRSVFDVFQDDITFVAQRQAGYLWLIGDMVQALGNACKSEVQKILNVALTILSNSNFAEVHTEALYILIYLYRYCPDSTHCNEAAVLNVIEVCMGQGSPEIIGKGSYLLSMFFRARKESACQYLEPPLRCLFGLMNASGIDPKVKSYCEVVYAIGRIFDAMTEYFPAEAAMRYLEKLCELVNVPVDPASDTDREQASFLYEVIASGFTVFIKRFDAKGDKDSMNQLQVHVFQLVKNVDRLKTTVPMTLIHLFDMLIEFGEASCKPRQTNLKMRNAFVKNILERVGDMRDDGVLKRAVSTQYGKEMSALMHKVKEFKHKRQGW